MDSLSIAITDPILIDGLIEAANRNNMTVANLVSDIVETQARNYASLFNIGSITGTTMVARLTPDEYYAISRAMCPADDASEEDKQRAAAICAFVENVKQMAMISVTDPSLVAGLNLLVEANLIAPERVEKLLAYRRPEPSLPAPVEAPEEHPEEALVRARNDKGEYVADDPSTPENEAWEPAGGEA